MPDHLAEYVATWTQVNPGWDHQIWSETELDWLANQALFDRAEEYTTSVGQFRSDVARYEILHRFGGVYVDCDFEALKPIDELLAGVECFAAWEIDDLWVNNAIIGSTPGHPFLAELIAGLPANVRRKRGRRPNVMTGPQYVTPVASRYDLAVFPSTWFYPYAFNELDRGAEVFPDAYAVHHWHNARSRLHQRVRP